MIFVDRSLSRGLADKFLADVDNRKAIHARLCPALLRTRPLKRADVRRLTNKLIEIGEKCSFTQIAASHPRWRWAGLSVFIPTLVTLSEFGQHNRTLSIALLRLSMHVGRATDSPNEITPILGINEHAFERLFQRMNVLSPLAIEDELHEALCISILALRLCAILRLAQIVIPTKSGLFLCEVSECKTIIIAKTWLPKSTENSRYVEAGHALATLYKKIGGKIAIAEYLATLPLTSSPLGMPLEKEAADELGKIAWLRDEYYPHTDPLNDTWQRARAQANHSQT